MKLNNGTSPEDSFVVFRKGISLKNIYNNFPIINIYISGRKSIIPAGSYYSLFS